MSTPGVLPEISCEQEYTKQYADTAVWVSAMQVLCDRHGLDRNSLQREKLGTHVAFRTGTKILKRFCKLWRHEVIAERTVLNHVHGLPIPEIVAEGELEGWPYLVMTLTPGTPSLAVWPTLDPSTQYRLTTEFRIGRAESPQP